MALEGQVFDFSLNDSSIIGMLQKINSFTDVGFGGVLGIFLLIVIGGVLFLMMKSYGNERALSVTMLITSIIGLLLRLMGLITDFVFYVCIVLFVVGVILLFRESEKYD